jgi:hypothetical protein
MAKFIQVCASHNALFALDEEGVAPTRRRGSSWSPLVHPRRRVSEAARGLPLVVPLDRLESLPSCARGGQGPSGQTLASRLD